MEKEKAIIIIEENCPICDKTHKKEIKKRKSIVTIKGEQVEYDEYYYICNNADNENEYVSEKLMDENLQRARDSYRVKHKLLTTNEIVSIRKKYNLTQLEFSRLLGLGDITITRYESRMIQEQTYDSMIRLVGKDSLFALEALKRNKEKFKKDRYEQIEKIIKNNINEDYYIRQEILSKYVPYSEKSKYNGNKILDIQKLESIIGYIAQSLNNNLFKVKLMKFLWYADFINYKLYNHSMTGLVYAHNTYGALPIAYNEILKLPSICVEEKIDENENVQYKISYNKAYNIKGITSQEIQILNKVINKFKSMKTKDVVEYMHQEKAYIQTQMEELISYEYAKEVTLK